MIDFHCHLDLFPNPSKIVKGCLDRELFVLAVTTTPSAWIKSNELGKNSQRIKTALGLHPQLAQEREDELQLFDNLLGNVKYVGEIGLDGSPELKKTWDAQLRVFNHILRSCQNDGGKILSIHSRRAVNHVLEFLEKYPNAGVPILHWYSGKIKDLKRALDLECWFSINPAMVKSKSGINIISNIPKEKIVPETDSPFTGMNGKSYNPWDVELVFSGLSNIWNISVSEAKSIVWQNCKTLLSQ
jgi:TatD DNase family protein